MGGGEKEKGECEVEELPTALQPTAPDHSPKLLIVVGLASLPWTARQGGITQLLVRLKVWLMTKKGTCSLPPSALPAES